MRLRKEMLGYALAFSALTLSTRCLFAQVIYPGPSYQGGTVGGIGGSGGYNSQGINLNPGVTVVSAGGFGVEVAHGTLYYPNSNPALAPTTDSGTNSFFFTSSAVTPFGSIGTLANGHPNSTNAYAINSSKMTAGDIINSTFSQFTAAEWDSSGNPTALLALGTATNGNTNSVAYALDGSGDAAGKSTFYSSNTSLGGRPVFWASGTTTPTALAIYDTGNGNFGSTNNYNSGYVAAINGSGTMVGDDEYYLPSGGAGTGGDVGGFASVWSLSNPGAIEKLADLPGNGTYLGLAAGDNVNATTVYSSNVRVVNSAGIAGGTISKYDSTQYNTAGGGSQGNRPVRWNTGTNTVQLLDAVGTATSSGVTGYTSGDVYGINSEGDVVGVENNYNGSGTSLGSRPELWKGSTGTAVTPLQLLGTSSSGVANGSANGINDGEWSVGGVSDYSTNGGDIYGTSSGNSVAALWDPNGNVTDLNALLSSYLVSASGTTAGWVILTQADGITNDGWIAGYGTYNPGGGYPNYTRTFLIQDSSAVPEPAGIAILITLTSVVGMRRRTKCLV